MLIGYARVSTDDQNLDLQRDALQRAGCERIFEEKESGRAGTKRPARECPEGCVWRPVHAGFGHAHAVKRVSNRIAS